MWIYTDARCGVAMACIKKSMPACPRGVALVSVAQQGTFVKLAFDHFPSACVFVWFQLPKGVSDGIQKELQG